MANTLPLQACVKSNASLVKLISPPPFLFLFLLLLLSLLLALSLLHISDLLTHSLSSPPLFPLLSPLLLDKQDILSHLLLIYQHYLGFLLSPFPIFMLANLIVFTLLIKSIYFSSSLSADFPDFGAKKSEDDDASLPEHALPSHGYFFLSPSHQQFVFSHDTPEEYHVLSFNTNHDESTYYKTVQKSNNKLSNTWEKVQGVGINPYINSNMINGGIAQKEMKRPDKVMMVGKVQSTLTVAATPGEKGLQVNERASRPTKAAAVCASLGSQAVVINIELPPARRTRIPTNTGMQDSHPPLIPPAPLQHPVKTAPPPSNTSMSAQRPPSSPRVKKSLQSTGGSANDARYEASKPILDGEKQALRPNKPQKKSSSMVRSSSDQRLSQRDPSTEVSTVLTSPSSFTKRPHMQRAQSLRSSSTPNTISNVITSSSSTNNPHMQRTQSLRGNGTPNSSSHGKVTTRSPCFSASLDDLSDADANKLFSDFITHRFSLMKKELD